MSNPTIIDTHRRAAGDPNFAELHARALGFQTNWTSIGAVRVLEISGVPFGIACFPCNGRAPRGYAIPVIIADEIAHWATDDEYVNADTAVLGAVKPAMAQFPDSKLIAISSPLGETGLHFETVEANLGDDAERERFLEQMTRLASYRVRALVVEASWAELAAGVYRSNMNPKNVTGTLLALVVDSGIPVLLVGSAREAAEAVERMMLRVARNGVTVAA